MTTSTTRAFATAPPRSSSLDTFKVQYRESISQLADIFSNWTPDDLAMVLFDVEGDLVLAVQRISEGHAMPWSEQGKKIVKKEVAPSRPSTRPSKNQNTKANIQTNTNNTSQASERSARQAPPAVSTADRSQNTSKKAAPNALSQTIHPDSTTNNLDRSTEDVKTLKPKDTQLKVEEEPSVVRYTSIKSNKTTPAKLATPDAKLVTTEEAEKDMLSIVSSLVEEEKAAPVVSMNNLASSPIVAMPKSLSSKISQIAMVPPVVVMPLRATVRSGLSVSFGGNSGSITISQHDQGVASVRTPIIANALEKIIEKPTRDITSSSSRYLNTGIEAEVDTGFANSNSPTTLRNQPIQRPNRVDNAISSPGGVFLTSPPGLRSVGIDSSVNDYKQNTSAVESVFPVSSGHIPPTLSNYSEHATTYEQKNFPFYGAQASFNLEGAKSSRSTKGPSVGPSNGYLNNEYPHWNSYGQQAQLSTFPESVEHQPRAYYTHNEDPYNQQDYQQQDSFSSHVYNRSYTQGYSHSVNGYRNNLPPLQQQQSFRDASQQYSSAPHYNQITSNAFSQPGQYTSANHQHHPHHQHSHQHQHQHHQHQHHQHHHQHQQTTSPIYSQRKQA